MFKFTLSFVSAIFIFLNLVGCSSTPSSAPSELQPEIEAPVISDINSNENPETEVPTEPESSGSESKEESELAQLEANKEIMSRLYYYDIEEDKVLYVEKEIEVIGGAYINALTNELKNNQTNPNFVTMSSDTFVTSAKLDEEQGILNIYFNESFYLSTNLGSGIEVGFIDSIVNTYGYNYQVDKVAIYVENKLYEDQRGPMPDGYFPVTVDNATQY